MRLLYISVLLVAMLFMAVLTTPLFSLTIKLQNGAHLQGEIVDSNETSFEFKRWDTGGVIKFNWDQLPPEESQRIRNLLNIRILGDEVSALKIYFKNGEILTGMVIDETNRYINLKTRKGIKNILKDSVLGSEFVRINILEVYAPEEIYEMELKRYDLNNAGDCYKLAEYCLTRLGLLDKARELFNKCARLDEKYIEKVTRQIKEMNNELCAIEVKKINELLEQGDLKGAHLLFDNLKNHSLLKDDQDAQKIIQQAGQKIESAEKQIKERKDRDLSKKVINEYYKTLESSLAQIVNNTKVTYTDIINYVNSYLAREIISKVAKNLDMKEVDVQRIWTGRTPGMSTKKNAFYGDGSFIAAPTIPPPPPDNIEEYRKHQEKMRLINEAKVQAARKRTLLTAETWWGKASIQVKQPWLEAYFAQRQMKVIDKKISPCQNCHGEGVISKSKKVNELCPRCQGCTADLIIIYY